MFAMIAHVLNLVLIAAAARTSLNTLTVRGNLERAEFGKCTIMPYFKLVLVFDLGVSIIKVMIHDDTTAFDSSFSPNERREMSNSQYDIPSCPFCEDGGWEFGAKNYCACDEGSKLFRRDGKLGEAYVAEFFNPSFSKEIL